jgi:hypothetical protein
VFSFRFSEYRDRVFARNHCYLILGNLGFAVWILAETLTKLN